MFVYIIRIIGAIFCQVNIIKELVQSSPSIISGNQKWNGAAPILVKNAVFMINLNGDEIEILYPILRESMIIANKIRVEASAWVTKYFSAASVAKGFLTLIIKGIIDKRLISNPIHIPIQEYEEIEIMVPTTSDE